MRVLWILAFFGRQIFAQKESLILVEQNYFNRRHCVTNDTNKAIVWNTLLDDEYKPETVQYKGSQVMELSWDKMQFVKRNLGLVLDSRWESFPLTISTSKQYGSDLVFKDLMTLTMYYDFELPFSIRGEKEAHIYICEDKNKKPSKSNCVWFLLGAWGGTKSAIRKCKSGEIQDSNVTPKGDCQTNLDTVLRNPLKSDRYIHFIVQFSSTKRTISLKILGEDRPFLNYVDTNYRFYNFDYNKIWVNSRGGGNVFWKVHNYDYYTKRSQNIEYLNSVTVVNKICISMYAVIFQDCQLILYLQKRGSSNFATTRYYQFDKDNLWQKISLYYEGEDGYYDLYAKIESSTPSNLVLIFDRITINNCIDREIKISTIARRKDVSCQYLLNDNEIINPQPLNAPAELELKCPAETIGPQCISCKEAEICDFSKICQYDGDKEICYCSTGYTGENCQKKCPQGVYGQNCAEKCGQCSKCDAVNGTCSSSCFANFKGTHCNETILPIIKEPPQLVADCYTVCNFSVDATNYNGQFAPAYYKVQYKGKSEYWTQLTNELSIEKKQFLLAPLIILQNYSVKVVLCTDKNNCYKDDVIPVLNFSTKCREITDKDISIEPDDYTVVINVMDSDHDLCQYTFRVTQGNKEIANINLQPKNNIVQNLKPSTNYNYEINDELNTVLSGDFTTLEAAPSKVKGANFTSTSEEMTVQWLPPENPNGIIQGYNVLLQHESYISCRNNRHDASLIRNVNVTTMEVLFKNLHAYSRYKITITAMNSRIGEAYILNAETRDADNLLPIAFTLGNTLEDTSVLLWLNINCTLVYSTYTVSIAIACKEDFVKCPTDRTISDNSPIRIGQLKPFVNYELHPRVTNTFDHSVDLDVIAFKTKPAAPNNLRNYELYDLDTNWMAFKFLPPYPPTGEIERYYVEIIQYGSLKNKNIYKGYIAANMCEVWNWMICIKTPAYLNDGQYYYINLQVKNKDVEQWSNPSKYEGYLKYQAPEKPLNIEGSWDDFYNLTLSWQHPNKTNGVLTAFIIYIDTKPNIYKVEKYNLTYTYRLQIEETDKENTEVKIRSRNKLHESYDVTWSIGNPPPKPKFNIAPKITDVTNSTFKVDIAPVEMLKGKSNLYIVIAKDKEESDAEVSPKQKELIKTWLDLPAAKTAWIALFVYLNPGQSNSVTIGNGSPAFLDRIGEEIRNRVLPDNEDVDIYFIAANERNSLERLVFLKLQASTRPGGHHIVDDGVNYWVYVSLLFLIIPIIVLIVYAKKRNLFPLKRSSLRPERLSEKQSLTNNVQIPETIPLKNTPDSSEQITSAEDPPVKPSGYSRIVNLSDFEEYVKDSVFNGELARQHALFPRGEQKPNDYGKLPQNKNKNRYQNLVAYNHSRVKLIKSPGDPYSDYINASYIKGLKSPRAYIATQGPKPTTVNDFWRMIWEENVSNIAMLANVFENGKKKTEQYWPNYNEELDFAEINVRHISTEIFADYEIRNFVMKSNGETRKVQQLHFNTWPDHGVPLYPQSLVPFVRKILTFPHDSKPIVVHCSAGVGRTGTIILIDLALRMAAQMGYVDILNILYQIRENRANMVDNIEQYKLAHLVILECLFSPDTAIRCNETFEESMRKIIEHDLKKQMDYIERSAWQENAITMSGNIKVKSYPEKDRFPLEIESYGVIYLPPYPSTDETSVYINATTVDGFRSKKRFIATQNPLPNTIGDFWRLAVDNEVDIIVSLQDINADDPTCCQFIPSKEQKVIKANPIISVHFTHLEDLQTHEIVTVSVHHKEVQRKVKIVILKEWAFGDPCASNRSALIAVWQQMNNLSWNENKVIVTCRDGFSASGMYLAMAFTLEKIKLEQVCDVCHAVRVIRRSRRQFVQSEEQFIALYEIVFLYLSEFELYANFGK